MSFLGQFSFGYPVVSENIITTIPNEAIVPLSIGSSLKGNILGVSFADLKSQISGSATWGSIQGSISAQSDLINLLDAKQALLQSGTNIKTINGSSILGSGDLTVGLPSFVEYNEINKTIWNNGAGNNSLNTSYGSGALISNTTGFGNTAIGVNAVASVTTSTNNTGVGYQCCNGTGDSNTAIGSSALVINTTGGFNTAIGASSLVGNTTGSSNTAVGMQTESNNFSACIILGRRASASANNQFVVGSSTENAGAITTETITPNRTWTVRINGANYKIPLLAI